MIDLVLTITPAGTDDINAVDQKTGKPLVCCDKSGLYAGRPGPAYTTFMRRWVRGTTFDTVAGALA